MEVLIFSSVLNLIHHLKCFTQNLNYVYLLVSPWASLYFSFQDGRMS